MRTANVLLLVAAILVAAASFVEPPPERITVTALPPIVKPKPGGLPAAVEVDIGEPRRLILLRLSAADHVAAARLIVNEDSRALRPINDGGTAGELTTDAYGILQVVFDWATHEESTHGRALRALSPHVVGGKKATRERHAVYRTLPAWGIARPALWDEWDYGPWKDYGANWDRARAAVRTACTKGFRAPCVEQLAAWGGSMDDGIALRRGLVRATCDGGAVNTFWTWPKPKTVSARVAAGGRT